MNNLNDTDVFLRDNVVDDITMTTHKSGIQWFKQFLLLNNIVCSVETLPELPVDIFCS